MKKILAVLFLTFVSTMAYGQASSRKTIVPDATSPGIIGFNGVFQHVFAAPNPALIDKQGNVAPEVRSACSIQNNGSHPMWVFFGPITSANPTAAVTVMPGKSLTCDALGPTSQTQISIAGTMGDAFSATQH